MNFAQVIITFALCAISFVSASLTITGPTSGSSKIVGVAFDVTASVADGTSTTKFNAIFTDSFNHKYVFSELTVGSSNSVTLTGMVGSYSVYAEAFDGTASASASITFTLTLPSLSFTSPVAISPATVPKINYGEPVPLKVATNGAFAVQYTAIFTCAAGYFQITGLNTGTEYSIVPAGIYGNAIISVTAIDSRPAMLHITITRSSANQPPSFIPGNPSFYPSIYANMQEDGNLEVLSVEYLNSVASAPI
jgi:hypothetical protein